MNPLSILYYHIHNSVDYPLRRFFRWKRKGLVIRNEPKAAMFDDLPGEQRKKAGEIAARLLVDYHLNDYRARSSVRGYRESLFYIRMIETAMDTAGYDLPNPVTVADIGPSSWFYVQGLAALLRWRRAPQGRVVNLAGYEPDAYQVQLDMYSRYDHALAYMAGLDGASYRPNAFPCQPRTFDLVMMLFPFVFIKDHLEWGLPPLMFNPLSLLSRAWNSLKPGGLLLIANQGEPEHQAELENLQRINITPAAAYRQDPLLFSYTFDRYIIVSRHG